MELDKIGLGEPGYPVLLKEITDPPKVLYFAGKLPEANQTLISIVGTRKATSRGKFAARKIAGDLAKRGITIVSGLAIGIDTAAHEGCLWGGGKTIAVLGNGLDKIYPAQNENLAKKIIETGGAVVSEYPEGTPPYPSQFLARNRIVSGLAAATVIIEAPLKSGALVTARLAAEQGRETMVVPGEPFDFNYRGSHKLLRDGARLVSSAEDILEDLQFDGENSDNYRLTEEERRIMETIRANQPAKTERIIEINKMDAADANKNLTLLMVKGLIKETANGFTLMK